MEAIDFTDWTDEEVKAFADDLAFETYREENF